MKAEHPQFNRELNHEALSRLMVVKKTIFLKHGGHCMKCLSPEPCKWKKAMMTKVFEIARKEIRDVKRCSVSCY